MNFVTTIREKGSDRTWEETFMKSNGFPFLDEEEALLYSKKVVESFNSSLRKDEKPREVVKVEKIPNFKGDFYICQYGCYLEEAEEVRFLNLNTSKDEDALNLELYQLAREITESWVGTHGFADYDEDDFEDYDEFLDAENEEVENAISYTFWLLTDDDADVYLDQGSVDFIKAYRKKINDE